MFSMSTLGPNLILDGLLVYYDFCNPNCFNGAGNTIYNLVSTKYNGTISSPTYVYESQYPQNILFSNCRAEYKIDFPESYTIISIAQSPGTRNWSYIPQVSDIIPMVQVYANNNWIYLAGETIYIPIFPPPLTIDTYANSAEIIDYSVPISASSPMNYNDGTSIFSNEYDPSYMAFYAGSWSSNSQLLKMYSVNPISAPVGGQLNIQPIVSTPTSITRTSDPNATVYLGNLGFNQIIMGAHLLYNRQLSDQEIQMTYKIFKSKFNLIY